MSWKGFLSQAGCVFFSNSRNSKGQPHFTGGDMKLCSYTPVKKQLPQISHRSCTVGAWEVGTPALRYFSVHSSDFSMTATQKSGPNAPTRTAPKSATILIPVTSEHEVSTPVHFASSRTKFMQNSKGYNSKRHQNHNPKFEKQSLHSSSTSSRNCTAGIAGSSRLSESGCTGSSETKLLPCLVRSSW